MKWIPCQIHCPPQQQSHPSHPSLHVHGLTGKSKTVIDATIVLCIIWNCTIFSQISVRFEFNIGIQLHCLTIVHDGYKECKQECLMKITVFFISV